MRLDALKNGLTEAEILEAVAWVRRASSLWRWKRWRDARGYAYLSVLDQTGEEIFLLGRQDGTCFADRVWDFSTLAEGETVQDVLIALEPTPSVQSGRNQN